MSILNRYSIALLAFIFIYSTFNLNFHADDWKKNVRTDGMGYYAYLPAIFIYHDLEFQWVDSCLKNGIIEENQFMPFAVWQKTGTCNKYYVGTSLCMLPFFLMAHGYAIISGENTNGYTKPYLMSVSFAAIFYALAGLLLFQKICRRFFKDPTMEFLLVWALGLGTQVFYYAICEPSMSHTYSFFFFTLFIYVWLKNKETQKQSYLILFSITLAIIILIRPINGLVVLFLPFISNGSHEIKKILLGICNRKQVLSLSLFIFSILLFTQLGIYKIQTGKWLVDSYSVESFDFGTFNLHSFLLSYKKGLFTYTPILVLPFISLIMFRRQKTSVLLFILPFLVVSYVLSSWWMWYYGGSFGMRAMLEFFPFLFMPLVMMTATIKQSKFYYPLIFLLVTFIIHCQIQTMQYRHGTIHWADMDAKKYWETYSKPPYNWLFGNAR